MYRASYDDQLIFGTNFMRIKRVLHALWILQHISAHHKFHH